MIRRNKIQITARKLLPLIKKAKFFVKSKRKAFKLGEVVWNIEVLILALKKLPGKLLKKRGRGRPRIKKTFLPKLTFSKALYFTFTAVFIISFISGIIFWELILKDLPTPKELTNRKVQVSTRIYDRNHELLYTIYKDKKRTPVNLQQIPPQVRLSTIAAEDKDFYTHAGFSIRGILRAIYIDVKNRKLTGGSTITQQLVKNALLTPERTLIRKLKEITLAIEVENVFSKDEILEMYLNEVGYGGTAYGIQEAARTFFNKDVGQLTLAESALLAGLPQSPTKFSPFGSTPEKSLLREKEVLRQMQDAGFITETQRVEADKEEIIFSPNRSSIKAPHFVFYVRDQLEEKYGKEVVEQGGLDVITTLDLRIQTLAEEVVRAEIDKLKNLNVGNGSVVVMNPGTGEVLAMVGSKDFFDTEKGGNVNVATRLRQPGSSIKIVNYAYALSNGLTPATIIPDTPTTFMVEGQPPYTPKNYEGEYKGNMTLRQALAQSRNIPAVKVLASYGVDKMVEMGTKMGITSWIDPTNYGLSLTLGGGEVRLIDLARVFATVADYGSKPNINSVLKITNFQGKVLEEFTCEKKDLLKEVKIVNPANATESASVNYHSNYDCGGEQVLDPRVSYMITDILKDNEARSAAFGSNSLLVIKNHPEVAVKTGTSNDLRDNLAIGYTRDYLVAVWIGNNDNSEMSRIASGVTGATPIFNKIMTALLLDNNGDKTWPVPEGMTKLSICPYTGTLSCEGCPIKMEWFLNENKPNSVCNKDWFKDQQIQNVENANVSPTPKKRNFEKVFQDKFKKFFR